MTTSLSGGSPRLADGRLYSTATAEQIMAMPAARAPERRWTLEEFYRARDAAPPGVRYELVDGEVLVTPSPHWTHQRIAVRLALLIHPYVRAHTLGELFTSPLDVLLEPGSSPTFWSFPRVCFAYAATLFGGCSSPSKSSRQVRRVTTA